MKTSIQSIVEPIYTIKLINGNQTTTLATAVSVTDLVFPLAANSRYRVQGVIHTGCNNTGGVKICSTLPAGAAAHMNVLGPTTGTGTFLWQPETGIGTLVGPWNAENNANRGVYYEGTITTGATPGNFQFQFASNTAGQTSTIFQEGTYLSFQKIA